MKKIIMAIILGLNLLFVPIVNSTITRISTEEMERNNKIRTVILDSTVYESDMREFRIATTGTFLKLHIIINTFGGDPTAIVGITNYIEDLKVQGIKITTEVSGLAFSAGAFLFMTGDVRIMHPGDYIMFHRAYLAGNYGTKIECPNEANKAPCDYLAYINNYFRQYLLSSLKDTVLVNLLLNDEDNFFTAEKAFELGICTHLK